MEWRCFARCRCCAGAGGPVCDGCARLLVGEATRVLPRAGRGAWALADGTGTLRSLVVAHKDAGDTRLGGFLAAALARAASAALHDTGWWGPCAIVPIPPRGAAMRQRGRRPVEGLARGAARSLRGLGIDARVRGSLAWVREPLDQRGLTVPERAANVRHALRADAPREHPALLVDDVITSGATIAEARRALEACGWVVLGAAAVTATPAPAARGAPGGRLFPSPQQ